MTSRVGYSGTRDPNVAGVSSSGVSGSGVVAVLSGGGGVTYATLNPLDKSAALSLSNGDLTVTTSTVSWNGVRGTVGKTTGKLYYEVSLTRQTAFANTDPMFGIARATHTLTATYAGQGGLFGWAMQDKSPTALKLSPGALPGYVTYSNNATARYGIYVDLDAGAISYSFNGVDQGVANSGQTFGEVFPCVWLYDAGTPDPTVTCYFDPASWLYPGTYPSALGWGA